MKVARNTTGLQCFFRPAFLPVEKNLLRFELFNSQNQPAIAVNLGDKVHFKAEYYYHNDFRKYSVN